MNIKIPALVVASFQKVFPVISCDTTIRWQVYGNPDDYNYSVNVGYQGASFDAAGIVEETFLEVQMNALPKRVQRRIRKSILRQWNQAKPGAIRAYAYKRDGDLSYYVVRYCKPSHERRKCESLIAPNGSFYNPKFR